MVNSKVIAVTVRPEPKVTESRLEIELAHLANVRDPPPTTTHPCTHNRHRKSLPVHVGVGIHLVTHV